MSENSDLRWKIDKLLRVKAPLFETERNLVALLLWTRTNDYADLWDVHPHLIPWIVRWAQRSSLLPLLGRLLAQVYLHADLSNTKLEPLGRILFDTWKNSGVMIQDVPAAVYKWLEQKKDRDEFLRELVLCRLIFSNRTGEDEESNHSNTDIKDSDAEAVFQETLRQLLNQNSCSSVTSQDWASLFWNDEGKISYWTPLLQWWIESNNKSDETLKNEEQQSKRIWAAVLLETVMKHLAVKDKENRMDWQVDDEVARKYVKFLMVCVVDPNDAHDSSLRTLAWSSMAMSIQASGWDWILHSSVTCRLGKAHTMCTFIRLAAGEWKIQLERSLQEETLAEESSITLQTCAQIIADGFTYLQQVASDEDIMQRSFSPEASLHLRRSMEEAMHTTVEFLTTEDAVRFPDIAKTAVRLFCPFLTEWDIFLERNTETLLHALAISVDFCKDDLSVQNAIIAGLATVLASSEGDDSRIDALNQFHLLDDRLGDFLVSCFDQIDNSGEVSQEEGTLQWCSQIIDLWTSMTEKRKILRVLASVRGCSAER
ncbi:hypothetical protein FisN_19Lh087 [Fistulifera solaris]|uniref:Uncharacterized protein n=1 Tax=Fistulifera solaris TaxID=1519565 RepID=A0A1Z5J6K4_FISSO|nr:hypothetical protein FisN_19Lh087 [Fistulifera solaris]|eukprot:GAX09627.1 hypothetical protein FisN_19Lh087 [Fistulifera solaris]